MENSQYRTKHYSIYHGYKYSLPSVAGFIRQSVDYYLFSLHEISGVQGNERVNRSVDTQVGRIAWCSLAAWRNGNGGGPINEVTVRRARLVLRWMTVSFCGCTVSVCGQSLRPTQPPFPSGMGSEYRWKGCAALQLGNASNTSSSHLPTKFSQQPNFHTFISFC